MVSRGKAGNVAFVHLCPWSWQLSFWIVLSLTYARSRPFFFLLPALLPRALPWPTHAAWTLKAHLCIGFTLVGALWHWARASRIALTPSRECTAQLSPRNYEQATRGLAVKLGLIANELSAEETAVGRMDGGGRTDSDISLAGQREERRHREASSNETGGTGHWQHGMGRDNS